MPTREQSQRPEEEASGRYWYTVGVLTIVATLGYLDRALLSYLVVPIRKDLGISDLQISLLLGFAFILLYGLLTIPMGYLADRVSRKKMIAAGSLGWSLMAIVTSTSRSFWQMFLGRVGLGMGEAVLPPAGLSLIRDTVPPHARGRAISLYNLVALNVGNGLAGICAGGLMTLSARGFFSGLPVFGHLRPWQMAIFWPGAIGLVACLLVLTIREPIRRTQASITASDASFAQAWRYVRTHRRVYATILGAVVFANMATTGWSAWLPAVIGEQWTLTPAEVGPRLGTLQLVLGPIGAMAIGWIMDRHTRRRVDGALYVSIIGSLIHLVPALLALMAPSLPILWTSLALKTLIGGGVTVVSIMVVAEVTPVHLLGKITAIFYLLVNLLGNSIGPTLFALIASVGFHGGVSAPVMLVTYAIVILVSVALLFASARALRHWHGSEGAEHW